MEFTKKFYDDLHKIGQDAFIEKNMWIGKLVPEIIADNLQKRGINQEDIEGCVMLTVEEAKDFLGWLHNSQWKHRTDLEYAEDWQRDWIRYLKERIEKAEGCE